MEEENKNIPEVVVHAPDGVVVEVHFEYKYPEPEEKAEPVEEAPAEEVPAEEPVEAPVEEASSEEEPALEEPAEEPVEEEAPAEEAPAEEESVEEEAAPEEEPEVHEEGIEPSAEEVPAEEAEERIIASPEELKERIAELEAKNASIKARMEQIERRKEALAVEKIDGLYEDFVKTIEAINDSSAIIAQGLADTQVDFSQGVRDINDAYYEVQLEKAVLKAKEVK